ncbi:MAG: hypothetical protein BGO41_07120 [Clostridiales bacterium 38-18]|nr:MAG: hypothetical protein BGO41_07120 [Clostridiales bacterium 38-18]
MEKYTSENLLEALKVVDSTISKCEKMQPKFSEGTSQHSLLKNRIKSLYISKALITDKCDTAQYSIEELNDSLKPIVSIINKCVSGQRKHEVEDVQYKRFQKLIDAMDICKILITNEIVKRG